VRNVVMLSFPEATFAPVNLGLYAQGSRRVKAASQKTFLSAIEKVFRALTPEGLGDRGASAGRT